MHVPGVCSDQGALLTPERSRRSGADLWSPPRPGDLRPPAPLTECPGRIQSTGKNLMLPIHREEKLNVVDTIFVKKYV